MTAKDLLALGVIDDIIPEPLGGAHRDPRQAAVNLERYLNKTLRELKRLKPQTFLQRRYKKLRELGRFFRLSPEPQDAGQIQVAPEGKAAAASQAAAADQAGAPRAAAGGKARRMSTEPAKAGR